MIRQSSAKFVKVRCDKCKNEQVTFMQASTAVRCLVCNEALVAPTGGKADIIGRVLEVLE